MSADDVDFIMMQGTMVRPLAVGFILLNVCFIRQKWLWWIVVIVFCKALWSC